MQVSAPAAAAVQLPSHISGRSPAAHPYDRPAETSTPHQQSSPSKAVPPCKIKTKVSRSIFFFVVKTSHSPRALIAAIHPSKDGIPQSPLSHDPSSSSSPEQRFSYFIGSKCLLTPRQPIFFARQHNSVNRRRRAVRIRPRLRESHYNAIRIFYSLPAFSWWCGFWL
jgi:hypothetical protein